MTHKEPRPIAVTIVAAFIVFGFVTAVAVAFGLSNPGAVIAAVLGVVVGFTLGTLNYLLGP